MKQTIQITHQESNKNLSNTSQQGRALDELVPSRYALRVGEIEVLVISDGVLTPASRVNGHKRRSGRPGGLAGRQVPVAGRI